MAQQNNLIVPNKWLITLAAMTGTLMAILDSTIVNIALPKIMASYGVNIDEIEWVVTAYLMALSVSMPVVGWLSGAIGQAQLYVLSLAIFTFSSALCGLAWSEDSLIFFRVVQGLGAGAIMPAAMAIMYESFPPHQRGFAMGIYGVGVTLGPAIGPVAGGYITEYFNWRWIFYVNLPIGLIGVALAAHSLRGLVRPPRNKFDAPGFIAMAIFLSFLLVALSRGQNEGWWSGYILGLITISALAFIAFLIIEMLSRSPLIELNLYAIAPYSLATIVGAVLGVGLFGTTFLAPMFLENLLDYTAFKTGLLMLPGALAVSVVLPFSGVLADKLDNRVTIVAGLIIVAISQFLFSRLDLMVSSTSVAIMFIFRGLGLGMIFPSLVNATLGAVPPRSINMASGLLNVTRQLGGSFGISILSTLLATREDFHKSIYSSAVTYGSFGTRSALAGAEALLRSVGQDVASAKTNAFSLVDMMVRKQASVAAFQDSFYLVGLLFLAAIIPALLIFKKKTPAPASLIPVGE